MIASALRAEIQQFLLTDPDRRIRGDLARLALGALRERDRDLTPATFLACQALCEFLVADGEGRSLDGFEAMLDALDELVEDPAQLPSLRAQLRSFIEHIEQLFQESSRAPRRQPALHVSAA
jgi:hypothetical protein